VTNSGENTLTLPPGACVVTDEASLTIAADRFYAWKPGCPVVIDSLATTLAFTHGVSVQAGADADTQAVTDWQNGVIRGYGQLYERRSKTSVLALLNENPRLAALTHP
jgi:hypothetical protein